VRLAERAGSKNWQQPHANCVAGNNAEAYMKTNSYYRELLRKYIAHVTDMEGTDFIIACAFAEEEYEDLMRLVREGEAAKEIK
jgi:hypothetical protein